MADQWKRGKLNHCNGIVESDEKKLIFIENSIATNSNNKKDTCVTKLVGDADLTVVEELSLCSKQLTHLPEEFGVRLGNLVCMDLSINKLETLPSSLQCLTCLKSLNLNQNRLETLPLSIMKISSLKELQLSGNCIKTLPNNLGDLQCLEMLNLSCNYLTELPKSCGNLNQLKTLDLSGNAFKNLPSCVTNGMRSLESLDISKNLYIKAPTPPASKKLKRLYIKNAGHNIKFPVWLLTGRTPDLRVLDCDGTEFKCLNFPENPKSLKLQTLSLENCGVYDRFVLEITSLTDELESLRLGNSNLEERCNAFWKIPINNLKRPKLLTELSVRGTGLPTVCQEIGNFINLVKLDLSNNNIYWLPNEICLLNKLDVLIVDGNDLSSLPDNIGQITSLKELKASKNHIAILPRSMRDLRHLSYLDLYDNELEAIPEDLRYMENLLGVDIDHNNFDINDLSIRDLQYETLRNFLRNRYEITNNVRSTGPRYKSDTEELSDSSSDISSILCDKPDKTINTNEKYSDVEENWDISDNSADEFDPNSEWSESSRKQTISFSYVQSQKFNFCPADLHNMPVRQQVAIKKQNGEITDHFGVEEGQFEDA